MTWPTTRSPAYPEDEFAELDDALFMQVSKLIQESHARVFRTVNSEMTELYWQVGNVINQDLLGSKRAEYGAQAVQKLANCLTGTYGRGWSAQQLRHCRHLAHTFAHDEIFSALRRKLSWTSIKTIMYINDPLKRKFYIEMCKLNGWSSRVLERRIKSIVNVKQSFLGRVSSCSLRLVSSVSQPLVRGFPSRGKVFFRPLAPLTACRSRRARDA